MGIADARRLDAADMAEFGEIAAAAAHSTLANLLIIGADSMSVNMTANTTNHGAAAGYLCGRFAASLIFAGFVVEAANPHERSRD